MRELAFCPQGEDVSTGIARSPCSSDVPPSYGAGITTEMTSRFIFARELQVCKTFCIDAPGSMTSALPLALASAYKSASQVRLASVDLVAIPVFENCGCHLIFRPCKSSACRTLSRQSGMR